jgi:hypothetical protein
MADGNIYYAAPGAEGGYYDPYGGQFGGDAYQAMHQAEGFIPAPDGTMLVSPCADTCIPCFAYTRAEVFVLDRERSERVNFASQGPLGPIVLSTENIDFEAEAGIRGVVGVPICENLNLEASYFGLHKWDEEAAVVDPTRNLFSVFSGFGVRSTVIVIGGQNININQNALDGSSVQAIAYRSDLHNADLVLKGRWHLKSPKQELWLQAGTRYLKLREQFDYLTQVTGAVNNELVGESFTRVETDNDLVGFQLGGEFSHFFTPKLRLTLETRNALMVNFAEQQTDVGVNLVVLGLALNLGQEEVVDESIAFVTEAGVSLTYDITCWMSVTGGYRMMYVDGLALAPENFNTMLPIPGTGLRQPFLDHNGSLVYQGATAGLEIRW